MDVTDVLRDRMDEPSGLQYMAAVSIAAHVAVFGVFMLAPGALLLSHTAQDPAKVMTITLSGGGEGPQSGGLTPVGGRPVQAQTPPDAPREAVRPPAAAAPVMTVPTPGAKPAKPAAPVKQAPDEARGRTPTKGEGTRAGSAVAVTGARGEGFGLSTGAAGSIEADVSFLPRLHRDDGSRVKSNWTARQNVSGLVIIIHDSARRR
jgi:hypothetical protein